MTSDRRPPNHPSSERAAATAVVERRAAITIRMPAGYYDPDASSFLEPRPDDRDERPSTQAPRDREVLTGAAGSF